MAACSLPAALLLVLAAPSALAGDAPPAAAPGLSSPEPLTDRVRVDAAPARAVLAACEPPGLRRARERRGPIEMRDEWMLTQPRLSLPSTTPDPLPCGQWTVRFAANRGNDFGWTQTRAGELPQGGDRRFLVDGEHSTADIEVRRGLGHDVDVGVRLPYHWRGAGFLDGFIDDFHQITGLLDNIRSEFLTDVYRVEGRTPDFDPFSWPAGSGLGNLELSARWGFLRPCEACSWALALVGRVTLPTGTGVYEVGGVDAGLQLVAARPLARRLDLYLGAGATWFSELEIDGVEYEPWRFMGFAVLEWRPIRRVSLFLELTGSTNLVTNVALYPERQIYLNLGAKVDLSRCWQFELAVVENLEDQQSTTDFGVHAGLVARF